jgi:hypothetical protein
MRFFENLSSVKEIFTMVAAICVAFWAVYGMWIKKEQMIADLKVVELQQNTALRSSLLPSMAVQQYKLDESSVALGIDITLENMGNEDVRVLLDERAILISKVDFVNNEPVYGTPVYLGNSRYQGDVKRTLPFLDVGEHEKYDISYIYKVSEPGVYLVRFLTEMKSESVEDRRVKNFGDKSFIKYNTGVDKVVNIQF